MFGGILETFDRLGKLENSAPARVSDKAAVFGCTDCIPVNPTDT